MGIKKTIIYFAIVITAAVLLLLNAKDTHYTMVKNPVLVQEDGIVRTEKISLPKGDYQFILNYKTSFPVKVTIQDGPAEIAGKIAKESATGDYIAIDAKIRRSSEQIYLKFKQVGKSTVTLYNYEISSPVCFHTDMQLFTLLFLFFAIVFYTYLSYGIHTHRANIVQFAFFVVAGLVIFTSYPMFTDYLVYSHDLAAHLMRIEGVKDALLDGQLIATIYPHCNNGYGVLGFTYPNLMLYPFAILRIFNVSLITAYQLLLVCINIATAVSVYFAVKSITKTNYTSLIACVLYMLSPYRLNDLYIRGALGESLALIFLPLILAGIYHVFLGNKKKWYLLCIGYTGVLQSHIITCVLVAILSVCIGVFLIHHLFREKRFLSLLKGIIGTLLLNSFFLYHMVKFLGDGLGIDSIQKADFYADAIFPGQLLMSKVSTYTTNERSLGIGNEMPLSIGIIGGICFLILFVYLLNYKGEKSDEEVKNHQFIVNLSVICSFLLFATTTLFPWKQLTEFEPVSLVLSTIQFSFRFLELVTVILAVLCGVAILDTAILKPYKKQLFLALTIIGLWGAAQVMDTYITQPIEYTKLDGGYTDSTLPEYWPAGTEEDTFEDTNAWFSANLQLVQYWKMGTHVDLSYMTRGGDNYIDLPLLYYRGYRAVAQDGTELTVEKGEKNRVRVWLPESSKPNMVHVFYKI